MFAVAEADHAVGLLRAAATRLADRGALPDHTDRALIACLKAADRRTGRLEAVAHHAARLPADLRGVLLDAGLEPTDWHSYLDWVPEPLSHPLDFPPPLADLVAACETRCVTACCGLEAYVVRADSMIRWAAGRGGPIGLTTALTQLEAELAVVAREGQPVVGHDMLFDHEWPTAGDCLAYFDAWRTEATRALAEVGGAEMLQPGWLSDDMLAILAGVEASRDFARLPVLADALEDAGCDSVPVLAHLRANHRHGWFCWAADLLAGR